MPWLKKAGEGRGRGKAPTPKKSSNKGRKEGGKIVAVDEGIDWDAAFAGVRPGGVPSCCPDAAVNVNVQRLFRSKLKGSDNGELAKMVSKTEKVSAHVFLYRVVAALAGTKKHLSTKFRSTLYDEFGLTSTMFSGLSNLAESEEEPVIRHEIMEALLSARVENPTERKVAPIAKWLSHSDGSLTKDELSVILKGSLEDERVTPMTSLDVLGAAHKFIGQHKLHERHSDVWDVVIKDPCTLR